MCACEVLLSYDSVTEGADPPEPVLKCLLIFNELHSVAAEPFTGLQHQRVPGVPRRGSGFLEAFHCGRVWGMYAHSLELLEEQADEYEVDENSQFFLYYDMKSSQLNQ